MRRISILLAALLLTLGGCGGGSSPTPATTADTGGAGSRHAAADVEFVRALIPHHQEGIELARAAAAQPPARTLAEAIIVTQQDEVVRMTGWLREWDAAAAATPGLASGATPGAASGATPGAASGAAPGAASGAASPPADPVRALMAHQEEAIKLAQREQANGTNPAALAFAKQVIESRAAQVEQLRMYVS